MPAWIDHSKGSDVRNYTDASDNSATRFHPYRITRTEA